MKSKTKVELINTIANQLVRFNNLVYGVKRGVDDEMRVVIDRVKKVVNTADERELDDFDLWVFVTYREGRMLSKNKVVRRQEPVSLVDAICDGFKLPSNTTFVKIQIQPVFKKDYDVHLANVSVYEVQFGVGEEQNLTDKQLKRRYGLEPEDNLFSKEDLQSESIFTFYDSKKKTDKQNLSV